MKTTKKSHQTIDREISDICRILTVSSGKTLMVVRENPAKGSSCKGMITIFSRFDFLRQEEMAVSPMPIARYAFYPDTLDSTRLGSVAIYSTNVERMWLNLKNQTTLFGHPILDVRIKIGRNPFVDVRFKA